VFILASKSPQSTILKGLKNIIPSTQVELWLLFYF